MITNKLNKASLKQTVQREEILKYILADKIHPTADMIYKNIVKIIPHISRTTVYNNLKALEKANIIKAITITGEDETRYDAVVEPHHHFVCEKCGKIYDIDICCNNFLKKNIEGHSINSVYAYFKGICKECTKDV